MPPAAPLQPPLRWVGLAGPTASGKTALALALAQHLPLEVISVDSALVYRGMDIGTAKPTAAERAAVPHHLIDLLEPSQAYSAAQFVTDAGRLMDEIRARGRLPLLVGGTMLYFKALIDGLDAMPATEPAVRTEIEAYAVAHGNAGLHAWLSQVDPVTAARLPVGDTQRLQRALEVWRQTGRPLSSFHTRSNPGATSQPAQEHLLFSLEPQDRAWLHRRIDQRFAQMLAEGLLEEVRALRQRPDLHADLPSMRCVGYRQSWEALEAGLEGPALVEAVQTRGSAATRQLAKRQLTWLRGMERVALAPDRLAPQQALDGLLTRLTG
ncbi:tRNA (adenosine(37)-N6)-dimethylallyltransferase MiaA [Ideonella livida]|uniref:tRNA dimethylallyltransferase n=1 Tax=Ideonella livida TaxID=2707176 RepID=A0A7C9PJ99_9BURK|nr:tRNA (adenosine(37)-N6)-dimethylallyltransferase MiaA [Ideonella livida]NDY93356.1 tRNA (adenosine(37)-N6)-dimethylallyltransferase MiaA [Ideonella livida]